MDIEIVNNFIQIVKKYTENDLDVRNLILDFSKEGKYRKAYLIFCEYLENQKLQLSDSDRKIDQDFYWLYIN